MVSYDGGDTERIVFAMAGLHPGYETLLRASRTLAETP